MHKKYKFEQNITIFIRYICLYGYVMCVCICMFICMYVYMYIILVPWKLSTHVWLNTYIRNFGENISTSNIYLYIFFQNIQYKYAIYKSCHKTKCKICTLLHAWCDNTCPLITSLWWPPFITHVLHSNNTGLKSSHTHLLGWDRPLWFPREDYLVSQILD